LTGLRSISTYQYWGGWHIWCHHKQLIAGEMTSHLVAWNQIKYSLEDKTLVTSNSKKFLLTTLMDLDNLIKWTIHLWDCREKFDNNISKIYYVSSNQTRKNKTRRFMVIILWFSLTKYQTITFIMYGSDCATITLRWLHQLLMVGANKYVIICSTFPGTNYPKLCILHFCHIYRSNAKTQET
jgi:hypothetical protein